MKKEKIVIYQVLPRLFGNTNTANKQNGSLSENGVGKFSDFDTKALKEISKMGFTHIWYTGAIEHATKTDYSKHGISKDHPDVVKGNAGSPYAIKDYYDICPDYADSIDDRMGEFEELVKRSHQNDLKVIIDFVPNHVARQYYSDNSPKGISGFGSGDDMNVQFASSNNYYYLPNQHFTTDKINTQKIGGYEEYPAKATGNNQFTNSPTENDWYETVKLNYGIDYRDNSKHFAPIPNTWLKMKDVLKYWASKGVDAFRCDMAEMVPVEFWEWVIPKVKKENKNLLFIAEIYNPQEYYSYVHQGKFDYLYDKVDLYDTLRDVICGHKPTSDITFSWQRVESVQQHMLHFLENHDEQRIASDFFAGNAQKAIPALHIATWMNTNPVMIYFGQELGEKGMDSEGFSGRDGRTTIFDYWAMDTMIRWRNGGIFDGKKLTKAEKELRGKYLAMLKVAREEKCIAEGAFYDLMHANYENDQFDSTKQFAFLRFHKKEFMLIVSNFSSQKKRLVVHIPQGVYDFMNIKPQQIKSGVELLSQKAINIDETNFENIALTVESNDSIIIKFN